MHKLLLILIFINSLIAADLNDLANGIIAADSLYTNYSGEGYGWLAQEKFNNYVVLRYWESGRYHPEFSSIVIKIKSRNYDLIQYQDVLPDGIYRFIGSKIFQDKKGYHEMLPIIRYYRKGDRQ